MPPSPCPSALSLVCTNPFVVDWEAHALAKLSVLEELVQRRGAHKPSCPFLDQAYLLLTPPTSSLLSFCSPWIDSFLSLHVYSFSPSSSCLTKSWASPGELKDPGPSAWEHAFEEQHFYSAAATAVLTEGECSGGGVPAAGSRGLGSAFGNWSGATAPKKRHRCLDHQGPPGSALCTTNWHISGHLWSGKAWAVYCKRENKLNFSISLHIHRISLIRSALEI